jgi:hypothetical protein
MAQQHQPRAFGHSVIWPDFRNKLLNGMEANIIYRCFRRICNVTAPRSNGTRNHRTKFDFAVLRQVTTAAPAALHLGTVEAVFFTLLLRSRVSFVR